MQSSDYSGNENQRGRSKRSVKSKGVSDGEGFKASRASVSRGKMESVDKEGMRP